MCGEKSKVFPSKLVSCRYTPACAGESITAKIPDATTSGTPPLVRGKGTDTISSVIFTLGTPPLVRGKGSLYVLVLE